MALLKLLTESVDKGRIDRGASGFFLKQIDGPCFTLDPSIRGRMRAGLALRLDRFDIGVQALGERTRRTIRFPYDLTLFH
jgi:hypothetical protein